RDISVFVVKASQNEPKMILKEAVSKKEKAISEQQPYKEIWMVFDDDNRKNLKTIFEEAKSKELKIAYCSLCIECWFLMHFEKKTYIFSDAKKVKTLLKKHIPGYHETMPGVYNELLLKYEKAKLNAEWLRKQKGYQDMYRSYILKPVVTIDLLIETIKSYNK
ncbi:MAG: RloB domain-containing protein, partial [Bacteroidota bacterium]